MHRDNRDNKTNGNFRINYFIIISLRTSTILNVFEMFTINESIINLHLTRARIFYSICYDMKLGFTICEDRSLGNNFMLVLIEIS